MKEPSLIKLILIFSVSQSCVKYLAMKDFAKILLKTFKKYLKKNVKKDDDVSTFSDADVIVTSSFLNVFLNIS